MKDMKSWDVGYDAGIDGKPMPATPEGGDEESLHHGYVAGEATYLASIRRVDEEKQDCHPLRWPIAAIGAALWTIAAILGWIVWEVAR